ncbi:MAG: 30S ribosomal protein S18 [Elusimicrobiota bacterium]|jgi:small subunit ribosomal protein S18|nr:30S ribosomal protein S18 [Elusimicrobiota bacterium]
MAFAKKPTGKYNKDRGAKPDGHGGRFKKGMMVRKKVCRFCCEKLEIDYKNTSLLRSYMTESAKVLPARATGTCAKHQRALDRAIKRARILAMLPFSVVNQ